MRNIIICCDGTGNEISENISNVLKLYRCLRKTEKTQPRQLVFYDPGVGTLSRPDPWYKFKQDFNAILGLATGYGLDDDVLAAYAFLVHTYQAGDQIYLFGFSRGAYTVRVLAGLIHKVGLITPEQVNLAGSGLIAYKQFSSDEAPKLRADFKLLTQTGDAGGPLPQTAFDNAAQFARITSSRWPTIRFVGVWDTVASVIVPRPDRFYWPSLEELAFTLSNPSVQTFRQAISIDERRCMFRLKKWDAPQTFKHNRFNDAHAEPQDILQVWFAGVHADIGGGYPEKQSGLSKYPLLWMIDEAAKCGLQVNQATVNQLAWGIQRKGSPFSYVVPDVRGDLHTSLRGAWWILEYIPKRATYKEWPARKSYFGYYIPDAEPRFIPDGAIVHESALERMNALPSYRPVNLPKQYEKFPMPVPPAHASAEAEEESSCPGLARHPRLSAAEAKTWMADRRAKRSVSVARAMTAVSYGVTLSIRHCERSEALPFPSPLVGEGGSIAGARLRRMGRLSPHQEVCRRERPLPPRLRSGPSPTGEKEDGAAYMRV